MPEIVEVEEVLLEVVEEVEEVLLEVVEEVEVVRLKGVVIIEIVGVVLLAELVKPETVVVDEVELMVVKLSAMVVVPCLRTGWEEVAKELTDDRKNDQQNSDVEPTCQSYFLSRVLDYLYYNTSSGMNTHAYFFVLGRIKCTIQQSVLSTTAVI